MFWYRSWESAVAAAADRRRHRELVEGIVVRVNDHILTVADMRNRVREKEAEPGAAVPTEMYAMLVGEAADEQVLLERPTSSS